MTPHMTVSTGALGEPRATAPPRLIGRISRAASRAVSAPALGGLRGTA